MFLRYAADSNLKRVVPRTRRQEPADRLPRRARPDERSPRPSPAASSSTPGRCAPAGSRLLVHVPDATARRGGRGTRPGACTRRPARPARPARRAGGGAPPGPVLGYIEGPWPRAARRPRRRPPGAARRPAATTSSHRPRRRGPRRAVAREEIFGPCLTVQTFETARRPSHSPTTPLTASPRRCGPRTWPPPTAPARGIRAGTVWVNCFDDCDVTVPFGGYKQSGFGTGTIAARLGEVHRAEDDLDQAVRPRIAVVGPLRIPGGRPGGRPGRGAVRHLGPTPARPGRCGPLRGRQLGPGQARSLPHRPGRRRVAAGRW